MCLIYAKIRYWKTFFSKYLYFCCNECVGQAVANNNNNQQHRTTQDEKHPVVPGVLYVIHKYVFVFFNFFSMKMTQNLMKVIDSLCQHSLDS